MPLSPHDPAQSYSAIYGPGEMPANNDSGWTIRRVKATGATHKMIRIHGPFDIHIEGIKKHCLNGWLALDDNNKPYTISDASPVDPTTEEID